MKNVNINLFCTLERVTYQTNNLQNARIILQNEKHSTSAIYLMTHKQSQRQYLGSTRDIIRRIDEYLTPNKLARIAAHHIRIASAILKHGHSAFSLEIIICRNATTEELLITEQNYFDQYVLEFNIIRIASGGYAPSTRNQNAVYVYKIDKLVQHFSSGTS